jgi:hypothetical protein
LLGELDDDAVGVPRMQERLLPDVVRQVDADRLDAESARLGQGLAEVGHDEGEVMRPWSARGKEALEEGGSASEGTGS